MKQKALILAAATAVLLLSGTFALACGDDEEGETVDVPGAAGTDTSGATSSKDIPEEKIEAKDFSFVFDDRISGGLTRFAMTNTGKEPHHAQIVRLNDGVTQQQFQAVVAEPDFEVMFGKLVSIVTFQGGPGTVSGGDKQTVVGDLKAGQHALLCFLEGEDGAAHLTKGMVKNFAVDAPSASGQPAPPEAKTSVTLADFAYLGAETLPVGKSTLEVTNGGPQPHEVAIFELKNGFTVEQFKGVLTGALAPPPGPPALEDRGGIVALAANTKGWIELDLPAGTNYAFACFVPDPNTGQPHAALGMLRAVTVK